MRRDLFLEILTNTFISIQDALYQLNKEYFSNKGTFFYTLTYHVPTLLAGIRVFEVKEYLRAFEHHLITQYKKYLPSENIVKSVFITDDNYTPSHYKIDFSNGLNSDPDVSYKNISSLVSRKEIFGFNLCFRGYLDKDMPLFIYCHKEADKPPVIIPMYSTRYKKYSDKVIGLYSEFKELINKIEDYNNKEYSNNDRNK